MYKKETANQSYLIIRVYTHDIHSSPGFCIFTAIAHVVQIITPTLIQVMKSFCIPQLVFFAVLSSQKHIEPMSPPLSGSGYEGVNVSHNPKNLPITSER
jgi:hypothetical protein